MQETNTISLWQKLQNQYQKNVGKAPLSIWTNPVHFVACGFGIGAVPFMPGTFGTLLGIPLALILSHFNVLYYAIACVALFLIGVWLCQVTNKDFGTDDHPAAVIDEIATFPVALIAIPMDWQYILAAFVLFRFFDIVKPGPIRWVDKIIHGGFGVMLDDLLAALSTLAILYFLTWVLGVH